MKSTISRCAVAMVLVMVGLVFSTSLSAAATLTVACANGTAEVGIAYSSSLVASGGAGPYTYSIASGGLPAGLTLDPSTGAITGTPSSAATFNYTAKVVDSAGAAATSKCHIKVAPSLESNCPPKIVVGVVGQPYSNAFVVHGGVAPYTFKIISGSLPPGLTLNTSTGVVSGTPTMAGTFVFAAQVMDSLGAVYTVNVGHCVLIIQPPSITLACAASTAQVGVPYSSALVVSGGTAPYTFSIVSGSLPPGLKLNTSTGAITGTPTTAGTFIFTAKVKDSTGTSAGTTTTSCSIIVSSSPVTLACAASTGQVGVPYSSALVATGGVPPYTFSITSGSLPPGLTLNPSTGAITGTPTTFGTFNFTAQVVDSTGTAAGTASTRCSIVIAPPPISLACPSATGQVGVAYSSALVATGGAPPYTFSITSGSLPPGLILNPTTGAITGTPTTFGTFNFTAKVVDSTGTAAGTATASCSIVIAPPPITLACPSATGQVGVAYSSALVATGGAPPYTFSITSGSLPPGLILNPTTGAITGTPTTFGTFNFTAKVVDSTGTAAGTATASCSIVIAPPPISLACPSATGQVGVAYSSALVATGGAPPYTFSITSGSLPPGLILNPTTGAITGTPTTFGTFNFTAKVVDSTGTAAGTATASCSIVIAPPPITLACPSSTGQVGVAYSSSLVATGGAPPYTFSITSGSLPPGLTLDPTTGAITGTPTTYGTFNFTAQVVDSTGTAAGTTTASCTIVIAPPPITLACASSTGEEGAAYSSSLIATGGAPPYTFSITSGSLPPGLVLNPSTGAITGTPTTPGTFSFTAQVVDSTGTAAGTATANCNITVGAPSLTIVKVADAAGTQSTVAAAGQEIGFTVTVTSNGPADAMNVTVSDPLPNPNGASSGINWSIDSTAGSPTCSISGAAPSQTLNCSDALLAAGSSFSVHMTSATTIPSVGVYSNCATTSANGVSPVPACASITVVGACTLGYPTGKPPSLTSVIFSESEDLVAAAACNASGCGEPVAGPNDWVALWYTDEHAQTLGVKQVAVMTGGGPGGTTTTNYPITALTTNPGSAMNPLVGDTMLGDNLFFPKSGSPTPQGLPNVQAGTDVATWNSTYFYLDSGRPLWPALFPTDITNDPTAKSGDYQQGGMTAVPPSEIFGTWKSAVRTVDTTKSPYAITVTPGTDPAKNNWNLGSGSDTPPGGFGQYPTQGYGTEDRWNVSSITYNGQPLSPGHAYRLQIMVHDGDQNKTGGDVGEACLNVVIPGLPGKTLALSCPAPSGAPAAAYSSAFGVTGGTPPFTFSIASGALPPGLMLDASTGSVTGTPTTAGTYSFTGEVTDSSVPPLTATSPGCAITIMPPPTLMLSKTASPTNVAPFQLVTYTYTVTNNGTTTLTNIVVTDDDGTPNDPTDDFTVGTIASLGPGASATLTWVGYPSYQTVITDQKLGVIPGGTLAIENVLDGSCTPNVNCNLKFIFNQSLNLNDNSYGTNSSSGWGNNGHKFSDLTGSDQAEWNFFDSKGNSVLFFSQDYISAATAPAAGCPNANFASYGSGYGTLGWCGGDGKFFSGDSSKIVSEDTTFTDDLNQSPAFYGYTTNSPAAGFPGWNFVDGYSVILNPAVFGANGFGSVQIPLVHNSPSKNGTDQVCESPGSSVSTNTATATSGGMMSTATASVTITSTIPPCTGK